MAPADTFESPGKYLRAKRQSQNLSLKEVADAIRIREPVLRALEEDGYANLPAIYVKSFLTAYAEYLGLDSDEVILVQKKIAEKRSSSKDRALIPPSIILRKTDSVRWWTISISVALLMALIVYAFFKLFR